MKPVEPIYTVDLFMPLGEELRTLLKSLSPRDWNRPTACASWTVKDVVAHLLGGSLGRLQDRDRSPATTGIASISFDELLDIINRQNALWVEAARRISPMLLIEFLELTDWALDVHFRELAPHELAPITVSWASDEYPPNWFDIAREYTEKWLHQQHIREAVEQPLLVERTWLYPVFDTFLRGLPRPFRNVEAPSGTSVSISIAGEAGGEWTLVRTKTSWELWVGRAPAAVSRVRIGQDAAWRLFTKGVNLNQVRESIQIEGDITLGAKVLDLVAIMA